MRPHAASQVNRVLPPECRFRVDAWAFCHRCQARGSWREGLSMCRFRLLTVVIAVLTAAAIAGIPAAVASAQSVLRAAAATPVNIDVSQRHLNESEEAIAVNPTNPSNIVTVTNVGPAEAGLTAGMFEGV